MVRHVVLFKFKAEADGREKAENVRLTKEMLDALPAKIPQIQKSVTYTGASEANPENCDLCLISDFKSFEDLNAYLVHPDHKAVGAFMRPLRESRAGFDTVID